MKPREDILNVDEIEPRTEREDLVGNLVIDFGSNMVVLAHPDVQGLRVRKNPATNDVVIDLFVFRMSKSLRLLVQEEYGGHPVRFHCIEFEPEFAPSLS